MTDEKYGPLTDEELDAAEHGLRALRVGWACADEALSLLAELRRLRDMWQPIETAPKDGRDILICMPGGHSDHYYPVCWLDGRWECRWYGNMTLTEEEIAACYLKPMWMELPVPPSSLCAGPGIVAEHHRDGKA